MEFDELKNKYSESAKKYNLPSFEELNEEFEIYKIDKDSDTILRSVIKALLEKVVNSLNFIEMLLNPMNAPRMYQIYIKTMGPEDRESIGRIYNELSTISMLSLEREIDYSEKAEAELISTVVKIWKKLKPDFRKIFNNIKKPSNGSIRRERNYFG